MFPNYFITIFSCIILIYVFRLPHFLCRVISGCQLCLTKKLSCKFGKTSMEELLMTAMLKLHLAFLKQHFIAQRDTEYHLKTTYSFLSIHSQIFSLVASSNTAIYSLDKTGTIFITTTFIDR